MRFPHGLFISSHRSLRILTSFSPKILRRPGRDVCVALFLSLNFRITVFELLYPVKSKIAFMIRLFSFLVRV